jgi:hypothetical protein
MTLSDFRAGHHPIDDVEGATFTNPDIPQLPRSPFWHAALNTPADRTGALVDFFPVRVAFPG